MSKKSIQTEGPIKLNLGCGPKPRHLDGYVNIDILERNEPDMILDAEQGLPFEDGSVEIIVANDFLEHVHPDKVIFVVEEIHRVLRDGGVFRSFTPSTDGRGAFQDPTHRSFWNRNSWMYYTLPNYADLIGTTARFRQIDLEDEDMGSGIIHTRAVMQAVK